MSNLLDTWRNLKPGDKILFQEITGKGISKPKLGILVGVDVWDMAPVIYFTDYSEFHAFESNNPPKVYEFAEWHDYLNVLGHWHTMPNFKRLLKAYRKAKPYEVRT